MMEDFCYKAYPIACFILDQNMSNREQMDFLEKMYGHEFEYLPFYYKQNKKNFILSVMQVLNYLTDKEKIDAEFPAIEQDFSDIGMHYDKERIFSDYTNMDMFFMLVRLRILYGQGKAYVRIKLKTLLGHYGYKRRSLQINEHIRDCLMFYHIQPFLRDNEECDIRDIKIDDMLTFRLL